MAAQNNGGGRADPNGVGGGGAGGGYSGLAGILAALQGGLSASQYGNMQQGYNGNKNYSGGTIGGMNGAFAGLSPWAINYLTKSGMLQQNTFQGKDLTGETGDDLFRDTLLNTIGQQNAASNPTYGLSDSGKGLTVDDLQQILGANPEGHSAYAPGYNANGRVAPTPSPHAAGHAGGNGQSMQSGQQQQHLARIHAAIQAGNQRLANHPNNQALLHHLANLHHMQRNIRNG